MNPVSSRKQATLHDVAKAAGVSLITASRALGNPGVVSKATIEKVHAAVEATGYIPNRLAGGLKSKRSLMVGGIVADAGHLVAPWGRTFIRTGAA